MTPPPAILTLGAVSDRMTVPVSIAGAGPYRFIIDTGAQRTVISRELAGQLGLPHGRGVRVFAMSGASQVATVIIPQLSVSTIGSERIEAPALEGANLGAAGMLGIDTLQDQAVRIDFDRQEMAILPSAKRRHHRISVPGEIVVTAKNLLGQLVVTDAYCDGQRVRVILDTGSAVSMGNGALRRRFARRGGPTVPIALLSVTGGTLNADYTSIGRIRIGQLTIQNLPIAYADAPPFARFGLDEVPAILLGMDALRLFRQVDIDFANREVVLSLPRDTPVRREEDGWRS